MALDNSQYILQKLQEECAEVIHIASKCVRFGLHNFHPETSVGNRDALVEELKDVLIMMEIAAEYGVIPVVEVTFEDREKRNTKFYRYKYLSKELGMH